MRKTNTRLRVLRAERGWTQLQVARRAYIGLFPYGQIERGERLVAEDERKAIAKALGVSVAIAFPPQEAAK